MGSVTPAVKAPPARRGGRGRGEHWRQRNAGPQRRRQRHVRQRHERRPGGGRRRSWFPARWRLQQSCARHHCFRVTSPAGGGGSHRGKRLPSPLRPGGISTGAHMRDTARREGQPFPPPETEGAGTDRNTGSARRTRRRAQGERRAEGPQEGSCAAAGETGSLRTYPGRTRPQSGRRTSYASA